MPADTADAIVAIRAVLREWDPIGVIPDLIEEGLPPDEYDNYAPYILGLLQRSCSVAEITAHLEYCRTGAMGLSRNPEVDAAVAASLLEWWSTRRSGGT